MGSLGNGRHVMLPIEILARTWAEGKMIEIKNTVNNCFLSDQKIHSIFVMI
jgi:hypothetical protein